MGPVGQVYLKPGPGHEDQQVEARAALSASHRGTPAWASLTDATMAAAQGLLEECGSALYRDFTKRKTK